MELLEKDCGPNIERIKEKFESVEVSLEGKIVKMEIDLLTANLELVNDNDIRRGQGDYCRTIGGGHGSTAERRRRQLRSRSKQPKQGCQ